LSESDSRPLFETLDPPPGGLTRLRTRIRKERRRRVRNRSLVTAAAAVVLVGLVALFFVPTGGDARSLPGMESDLLAIRLGMVDPPTETVSIRPDLRHDYAVLEVPTEDDRVVFYMVGSR
jgi:hypothetical protein